MHLILNFTFPSKTFSQKYHFNTISVRVIAEVCFSADIIFDVIKNTMFTEDKSGNALEYTFHTMLYIQAHFSIVKMYHVFWDTL